MQTKKPTLLDYEQLDTVTQTIRAYKHRFRYDIIGRLLMNGRMSSGEIASYLNLEENYIAEQLDMLRITGLVLTEESEDGIFFSANEPKLLHLKQCISSVFGNNP